MREAARIVRKHGAKQVVIAVTHAVFCGPAVERLSECPAVEVAVSNTIETPDSRNFDKLRILSVAPLLARAIEYTHSNESISSLFE